MIRDIQLLFQYLKDIGCQFAESGIEPVHAPTNFFAVFVYRPSYGTACVLQAGVFPGDALRQVAKNLLALLNPLVLTRLFEPFAQVKIGLVQSLEGVFNV